jgi:hypothetical protein
VGRQHARRRRYQSRLDLPRCCDATISISMLFPDLSCAKEGAAPGRETRDQGDSGSAICSLTLRFRIKQTPSGRLYVRDSIATSRLGVFKESQI